MVFRVSAVRLQVNQSGFRSHVAQRMLLLSPRPPPAHKLPPKNLFSLNELSRDASRWLPSLRQKPHAGIFLRKGQKKELFQACNEGVENPCEEKPRGERRGGEIQLADKIIIVKGFFQAAFWLEEVVQG